MWKNCNNIYIRIYKELIIDGESGFVVEANDKSAISKRIFELHRHIEKRIEIDLKGYEIAMSNNARLVRNKLKRIYR